MSNQTHAMVLLVEDNETDRDFVLRALKKANLDSNVHWLENGAQALEFIFGSNGEPLPPHNLKVIVTDLKMPKVDGLELLQRLKADARTKDIPVVMFTSSSTESDRDAAYKAGVNSFVVKPIDYGEFGRKAQEIGTYWINRNTPVQCMIM